MLWRSRLFSSLPLVDMNDSPDRPTPRLGGSGGQPLISRCPSDASGKMHHFAEIRRFVRCSEYDWCELSSSKSE